VIQRRCVRTRTLRVANQRAHTADARIRSRQHA
jgi:hypothetical protein